MEGFSSTPLFHMYFHARYHSVRLPPPLLSVPWQQNVMEYWLECSTSTAIPPTSASDIMGQHNKIGGITFRAVFIKWASWSPLELLRNEPCQCWFTHQVHSQWLQNKILQVTSSTYTFQAKHFLSQACKLKCYHSTSLSHPILKIKYIHFSLRTQWRISDKLCAVAVEGYYILSASMSVYMHTATSTSPHVICSSLPLVSLTKSNSVVCCHWKNQPSKTLISFSQHFWICHTVPYSSLNFVELLSRESRKEPRVTQKRKVLPWGILTLQLKRLFMLGQWKWSDISGWPILLTNSVSRVVKHIFVAQCHWSGISLYLTGDTTDKSMLPEAQHISLHLLSFQLPHPCQSTCHRWETLQYRDSPPCSSNTGACMKTFRYKTI